MAWKFDKAFTRKGVKMSYDFGDPVGERYGRTGIVLKVRCKACNWTAKRAVWKLRRRIRPDEYWIGCWCGRRYKLYYAGAEIKLDYHPWKEVITEDTWYCDRKLEILQRG